MKQASLTVTATFYLCTVHVYAVQYVQYVQYMYCICCSSQLFTVLCTSIPQNVEQTVVPFITVMLSDRTEQLQGNVPILQQKVWEFLGIFKQEQYRVETKCSLTNLIWQYFSNCSAMKMQINFSSILPERVVIESLGQFKEWLQKWGPS